MLGAVTVGVVGTEDEGGRVDGLLATQLVEEVAEALGVKGLAAHPAGCVFERLPCVLLGEQPEQDGAQEYVFRGQIAGCRVVDDLRDQVLGDAIGGAEGVAELVAGEDRVVGPRAYGVLKAGLEDALALGREAPVGVEDGTSRRGLHGHEHPRGRGRARCGP